MKQIYLFAILFSFLSCSDNRIVKHSGFDDTFFGTNQIELFENREFRLELLDDSKEGRYTFKKDRIMLDYFEEAEDIWPESAVMTNTQFVFINKGKYIQLTRTITRRK